MGQARARIRNVLLCCWVVAGAVPVHAEVAGAPDFSGWSDRVARTQAEQPHWITPLITVTPRLEQEFRSDVVSESQPHGASTTVYGNGKGLELIPSERIEVILGIPGYDEHNGSAKRDGFGDTNFLVKYRLLAANEHNGNYILTAFLGASAPTGTNGNGAGHAIFTPTLGFGKGWGSADVQSTLALRVPGGGEDRLGTPVVFNSAFQYLIADKIWPEAEINLTSWPNGDRAGKTELFLTPGVVVGRLPVWRTLGFTLGAGVQIAASGFHTSNHNWILSARLPF